MPTSKTTHRNPTLSIHEYPSLPSAPRLSCSVSLLPLRIPPRGRGFKPHLRQDRQHLPRDLPTSAPGLARLHRDRGLRASAPGLAPPRTLRALARRRLGRAVGESLQPASATARSLSVCAAALGRGTRSRECRSGGGNRSGFHAAPPCATPSDARAAQQTDSAGLSRSAGPVPGQCAAVERCGRWRRVRRQSRSRPSRAAAAALGRRVRRRARRPVAGAGERAAAGPVRLACMPLGCAR